MENKSLSQRQLKVMQVIWDSEVSLTASDITAAAGLPISTVQASLRSLVSKKYIEVGDVVYSGTVLSRTYVPLVSKEQYLRTACAGLLSADTTQLTMSAFVSEIASTETLDELERMIKQRRKELTDGREKQKRDCLHPGRAGKEHEGDCPDHWPTRKDSEEIQK